jgi:hypothetical protein
LWCKSERFGITVKFKKNVRITVLPYGSALPIGSALPLNSYGSFLPSLPYSVSLPLDAPVFPFYPVAITTVDEPEEVNEENPILQAREQWSSLKQLENEIDAAIKKFESAHLELSQKQATDFNTLAKEQSQVLTAQIANVNNVHSSIPKEYSTKKEFAELAAQLPTTHAAGVNTVFSPNQTTQIMKLSHVRQKVIAARQALEDEVARETKFPL